MKIYFRNGSSISRANLDGTGVEVFLENADIWKVDFDWITARRLFWITRTTDQRIYVMSLHNKKKRQLTETRLRNYDIAVDPTVG
jgi:Tol biopolymer transport system component